MKFINRLTVSHSDQRQLQAFVNLYNGLSQPSRTDGFIMLSREGQLLRHVFYDGEQPHGDLFIAVECLPAIEIKTEDGEMTDAYCLFWSFAESDASVLCTALLSQGFNVSAVSLNLVDGDGSIFEDGKRESGRLLPCPPDPSLKSTNHSYDSETIVKAIFESIHSVKKAKSGAGLVVSHESAPRSSCKQVNSRSLGVRAAPLANQDACGVA